MRRKGEIISMMPNRKDGKIDWLSTKDMDIEINSYNYGMHKFKVLDVYRNGLLTYLKLEYNGKYIGDVDCSLIYWGHIGMLIGKEVNICKKYFIENK